MSFQQYNRSPVGQDYIWMGEYNDGTHLSEFNFDTQAENSFYDIDKSRLARFGLVGHGMKLFFEKDGIFNLNGTPVEVIYRVGDKDYPLTGRFGQYKDIITYKDAEATLVLGSQGAQGGALNPTIQQYNFGYKSTLEADGITFKFKAVCTVPYGRQMFMNFRLVADEKLDGQLVILRNGQTEVNLEAPLKKGVGGEVNWIVG
ncbi:hypothetical protein DET54_12151 [Paenibacillus pabuli]|uniref:Uncharacterized protein n=1 Tax=Paenibacillus pabuli TaxID=1472 RepID=A0ABX9BCB8_9BACL|nr:hypothetical protein [Paenibacillus pabuli]RAI85694.1 hypothetical protein DET54_12151 [Paenibacillus pabuli]